MEALLESTEVGDVTLKMFREKIYEVYGDNNAKTTNDVYSIGVDILGNAGLSDRSKVYIAGALAVDALKLNVQNYFIGQRIKYYDWNLYLRELKPYLVHPNGYGGGATGRW